MEYAKVVEYLRGCPQIAKLLPVAGEQEVYNSVILPAGGSATASVSGKIDVMGDYEGTVTPVTTIYKDYQINCYRPYDVKDTNPPKYNGNALTFEEIDEIYAWVVEQDNNMHFPDVKEKIVAIECTAIQPYIRSVDVSENVVCYVVNVRIWFVNEIRKARTVFYEN